MADQDLERELTQHAASLRQLAAALVGNDDADDLVHETALRALRSRPRPGPLGGFLHTVLRRLASRHRRGEARRRQREHAAARPDRLPAVDQQLAGHEVVLRLARALAALPEPYRGALLSRYFEDRRPAVIAEREGVPVETVKTRLKRGLAMLRQRLAAEGVGDDWRVTLVATFGLQPPAAAAAVAAATTGVLLLGTTVKVSAGVAAMAIATLWMLTGESPPEVPAPAAPAVASTPMLAGVDRDQRLDLAVARRAVADPVLAPVQVHGRCVDEQGAPLAGVEATLRRFANGGRAEAAPAVRTQVNGRFAFAASAERGAAFTAEWRCAGRLHRRAKLGELRSGQVVDLGDLALLAGARVHGRVVDNGGQAVGGVSVTIHDLPIAAIGLSNERIWSRSIDDGTFAFDDVVPPGTWRLEAGGVGHAQVGPKAVTVHEGQANVELVVVCAPTPSIEGVVVDEAGKPVAGVEVVCDSPPSGRSPVARSAADGRFALHALDFEPAPQALAIGRGAAGYQLPPLTAPIVWGSRDVRIVLRQGLRLEFEVVERESGRPVEAFAVAAGDARNWPMAKAENGRRTIEGVQRGVHLFAVLPQDPLLVKSNCIRIDPERQAGAVRVEVERLTPLQVRVEDARGRPVGGSLVEVLHLGRFLDQGLRPRDVRRIWPTVDDDFDLFTSVLPILHSEATTDDGGCAALVVARADPDLGLRVTGARHAPLIVRQPTLVRGEPLVVTVEPAAALRGRLRIEGYASGVVGLALDARGSGPTDHGEGAVAPDGTFGFAGLTPGVHTIRLALLVRHHDRHGGGGGVSILEPPLATVDLSAGETRELDLDATRWNAGQVRGRIVVDGVGLAAELVGLRTPWGHGELPFGAFTTDEHGVFVASGLLPGDYTVRLLPEVSGAPASLPHPDVVTVAAGRSVEREYHFVRRRLLVRVRAADGSPIVGRKVWAKLGNEDHRGVETDAAGLATFDWMPIGEGRIEDTPFEIRATETEVTLELVVDRPR